MSGAAMLLNVKTLVVGMYPHKKCREGKPVFTVGFTVGQRESHLFLHLPLHSLREAHMLEPELLQEFSARPWGRRIGMAIMNTKQIRDFWSALRI